MSTPVATTCPAGTASTSTATTATTGVGLPPSTGTPVLDLITGRARTGAYGPDPASLRIALAFTTAQAVRHAGRARGYRNEVLSLRLGAAVGSCAVEPGELPADALTGCVGATVDELLDHPRAAVRVAALDAYLGHCRPHGPAEGARPVPLPAGSSLAKSRARAAAVAGLLPLADVRRVLVVGVVNSLLEQLRSRGIEYVPCDLKGGTTEWDEPVRTDALAHLDDCDAVLASGMTLGNGSLDPLLAHARATGKPLVLFAQTGSAVLPRLLGDGVSAVSAEPYPFFWLDGGPSVLHLYGGRAGRGGAAR
ncbi:Rossmann-like domain-containing protein [Kitasatospora sp. NPDC089913]|uniref:Rossmann-like domain-containing protein n=1 Tax=Kitasatospora sp. NPDC089913 TaxID=3364080 RepID=UPI00382F12CB